ncbi:hypothetical protein Tco_0713100 [Tanacetum coccineum]
MFEQRAEDDETQDELEINPEGDRFHTDLSKPLPFEGLPGRKTIPTRYFFNKYLAYLMHENEEKKYDLSLSKIKASRYEQEGIEEMIPHLWSPSIHNEQNDSLDDDDIHIQNLFSNLTLIDLEGYGRLLPCSYTQSKTRLSLAPGLTPRPSSGVERTWEMAPESLQAVVIPKFDMHIHTSTLTTKELKQVIKEYCIPKDSVSKIDYGQDFTERRRAILDAMPWRHIDIDVRDDFLLAQVIKDLEGQVITMDDFLKLPYWNGSL